MRSKLEGADVVVPLVSRRLFGWQRTVTLPDQNTFPLEGLRVAERLAKRELAVVQAAIPV